MITFGLNVVTARTLSPAAYGIGAVQFHLFNTSILFLSREGFRRGCLRVNPSDRGATRKILSIASLVIPIGLVLTLAVTTAILTWTNPISPALRTAIYMQAAAAVIEILSEPLYILATVRLWFGIRVWSEASALVAKNAITLALLHLKLPAPLALSWGQIFYATALLFVYGSYFAWGSQHPVNPSVSRKKVDGTTPLYFRKLDIDWAVLRVCGAFSLQAAWKLLLAEGSKAAMAAATPLAEQGVYGLVNNLGSLVVRTIFQPFEEVAFVAFSRPIARTCSSKSGAELNQHARLLSALCRGIMLLGCLATAFGPAYAHFALFVLYGRRWAESGADSVLAMYSLYIALLAVNGTLEAFVHAVADQSELHQANAALVAVSIVHIGLSVWGVKSSGAVGLLLADAVNMVLRIFYCLWFASGYFQSLGGLKAVRIAPTWKTQAALVGALLTTLASQIILLPEESIVASLLTYTKMELQTGNLVRAVPLSARMVMHVGVGVASLLLVVGVMYPSESEVVSHLRRLRRSQKPQRKVE